MPRFDGTGPRGMGPMTGRGLGPCGRGCGRGWGMGYGRGWGYRQPTVDEEKQMIKEDIEDLRKELKAAEEQLQEIENQK